MGFLKKLFGGGISLDGLRKAFAQQRYADARLLAEQLREQPLMPEESDEVERLGQEAGDALARLNLDEARGRQRLGQFEQAREHLELALEQVCSPQLRREIEQTRDNDRAEIIPPIPEATAESIAPDDIALPEDMDTRLELILSAYPHALAERYATRSRAFQDAFLLSHAQGDEQALALWSQVPQNEQDDLYHFERGSLLARRQQLNEAAVDLEEALQRNPQLTPALDVLIPLLVSRDGAQAARKRLDRALEEGCDEGFARARRAALEAQQDNPRAALEEARQALALGYSEPTFLALAASLHERLEQFHEAEELLQQLPAPRGCRGGISLPLAEFWLRRGRELPRVLEAFNTACREEPSNLRWQLRAAQTYAARGWHRDAAKLLRKLLDTPHLDPQLREQAERSLAEQDAR